MLAPAFALAAAIECLLDAVEEALGYQRLMVAGILHTAVGQDPEIVLVRQHGVDVALADRLGGVEASWDSGKPSGGQLVGEIGDGDVALGVAFEGPLDKRGSLGVDFDRAGLYARLVDPGIEVAQGSFAGGAAGADFLAHALGYFVGQVLGVELGDGAHDAVHQESTGCLVDIFTSGNQPDAKLIELGVDGDVVGAVAS
nr:hypothetical protein [Corynebacterium sanguinis]